MPKPQKINRVGEAVARLGGLTPTARAFGVTPTAISKWVDEGEVPLDRLARFCELVGSKKPGDFNAEVGKLFRDYAAAGS